MGRGHEKKTGKGRFFYELGDCITSKEWQYRLVVKNQSAWVLKYHAITTYLCVLIFVNLGLPICRVGAVFPRSCNMVSNK